MQTVIAVLLMHFQLAVFAEADQALKPKKFQVDCGFLYINRDMQSACGNQSALMRL